MNLKKPVSTFSIAFVFAVGAVGLVPGSTLSADASVLGDKIAETAISQIGQTDGRLYAQGRSEAWCADFVSWVLNKVGHPFPSGYGYGNWIPSVPTVVSVAMSGRHDLVWHGADYTPSKGNLVVYDWDHDGGYDHIGIVVTDGISPKSFTEVGGNQSGMVTRWTTYGIANIAGFISVGSQAGGAPQISDGNFISYKGNVYRIVGGAPLYISSFSAVAGATNYTTITDSQWSSLREVPRDGTVVVTQTGGVSKEAFVFAGGAPLYISDWGSIGGQAGYTFVDKAAITNAGTAYPYNHVRSYPADGTILRAGMTTVYYVVNGGKPTSTATRTGAVLVDPRAITGRGPSYPYNHLK